MEGSFIASNGDDQVEISPQSRQFFEPMQQTSEAALLTRWNGQLYAVIAPVGDGLNDRWQVRLWWKPFVTLIWFGAALIAMGGFLALLGRMQLRRRRKAVEHNPWSSL
jgi:cytochrome c-type biogenesis protein CcmF